MNTDSKWYKNINAYCLKAKLSIETQKDIDIHLTYSNSKYDETKHIWKLPVFVVEPNVSSDVNFVLNDCDFSNQYFNYFKRVVSVAIIIIILFAVLLYISIINSNAIAIITVSVLLLGVIFLVAMLLITQYKKCKKLYQFFLKQNIE